MTSTANGHIDLHAAELAILEGPVPIIDANEEQRLRRSDPRLREALVNLECEGNGCTLANPCSPCIDRRRYISLLLHREKHGKPGHPSDDTKFPAPVVCSELLATGPEDWLWHGLLAVGGITLLTALWKLGKSTLLAYLLRAMERGDVLCGRVVQPARALIITEESAGRWARRRDDLGLGDHLHRSAIPRQAIR